jgi:superfamily II DNA or RNA helicase
MKNQILYVYSTESLMYEKTVHKPTGDVVYKPWYKIGMTTQETSDDRILQQDRTSNPEPLIKLYDIDISSYNIKAHTLESKIHNYYTRLGKKVRDRREWYEVEGGVEEIKKVVESILNDSDVHKDDIKLKPHQIEANDKINECFNSDDKRCLLAHKPRSGKTFTTIYNIKENKYENVVILTSYPILNYQWSEIISGFKGFSDTEVIIGSELSKIELNPNKKSIILLSLQDVKGGEEVFNKEKFDLIRDIEFDLLVIDEVHHGVETEKTRDFLNKIKYKRMLGLSATPTKNLLCGRFSKEQIHNYTLVQEVGLKNKYPELYPYADINFLIWNLSTSEKNELKYFTDEEQFKFDKLFRIEGDEFYYKSDIIFLFKKLIGDRDICRRDRLETKYPFKNSGDFSVVKSILLFLPSIKVQYKLSELLNELDSYSDFKIHITNSDENSSKKLINKIKRDFKSGDKRSLILAVDQLTTGITLDDCDMVVLMNDWRSVDKYIQASFRCQSPRKDKKNCWVLDFNAARSFELMWSYQNIISKNNGKSINENIKEWIECVNIFNRVEGDLVRVDFDGFISEYNKSVLEKPRFNYQSTIFSDKLIELEKSLRIVGIKGGVSSTDKNLNDDGIKSGKSKKGGKSSSQKSGEGDESISLEELMEIAKSILDRTMLLSFFSYFKHDNIDDCFKDLIEDDTLIGGLGETKRKMYMDSLLLGMNNIDRIDLSIIKFIYDNLYDKEIINKKIYLFNQNINLIYNSIGENPDNISDMLGNLMELVDSYLKPSNTEKRLLGEVFTPLYEKPGCVEDQLNLMDESFWKRKDVKILDPCSGIGNYSVVLVDKFMKGLSDEIPDSEERLKWILEEIIYVNEYQSKNLFIYLQLFDPENKYKMNFHRGDYLKLDIKETFGVDKFDLICMNSPYQEMDGGFKASSKPLYNKFIEKSMKDADKVISINPSRWFAGGKGLDGFRKKMLSSSNIKIINHIDNASDVFGNSVKIMSGISYMLIDNNYSGDCLVNGKYKDISLHDILFIDDSVDSLIERLSKYDDISKICNSTNYFGIDYRKGRGDRLIDLQKEGYVKVHVTKNKGTIKYINPSYLKVKNNNYLLATPDGGKPGRLTSMFIVNPGEYTSDAFITFRFKTKLEVKSFYSYLNTTLCKKIISLRKISQHINPSTFKWIPLVPFDREWTDELLFDYFNLSEEERNIVLNHDKK